MGIAGTKVIQELELSKDGKVGGGAESRFEFGQSSDFVAKEMLARSWGLKESGRIMLEFRLIKHFTRRL